MPRSSNTLNYQNLFFNLIKQKYLSMMLGMFVALSISFAAYNLFLKYIPLRIAFSWPKINFSKSKVVTKKVAKVIPPKKYTIQEGDDLWHISEKFYGSGFNAYDISVANKMSDASVLNAGQTIIIPDVKRRFPTVGDISSISSSQVVYTEGKYVVAPGDSLSIIAGKVYGDINAWPRLLDANKLSSADQIEVGMVLTIPR